MKLEPIYLVSPQPLPASMPTRRAWFLAGACFALGAAGGIGGARWLAPTAVAATAPPPADERLAWLLGLCEDTSPIDSLIQNRTVLMQLLPKHPQEAKLWHGMQRLIGAVLEYAQLTDRRRIAQELLAALEYGPTSIGFDRDLAVAQLREVARGR